MVQVAVANVPWASTSISGGIPATRKRHKHRKQAHQVHCHSLCDARLRQTTKLRTSFQAINVLCVHPEQLTLLVKQIYKVVCQVGAVVSWIQLFGQGEEGIWVMVEKANLKYGLGVRQVILLQVVIETTAWRPASESK